MKRGKGALQELYNLEGFSFRAYPQRLIGPRVIEEKLNEVYPIRIGS